MSKHTPGPWHINENCPTAVNGPTEAPGVIVDLADNCDDEEAIPNAQLIAAAPEMLDALEAITTSDKNGRFGFPNFDAAIRQCLAAIAKAKGTS